MITDLASRAIAAWQAWKARREYERLMEIQRRHLLHDLQEAQ